MNKEVLKGGFQCIYTPVILIDSFYRKDKNNYPKGAFTNYLINFWPILDSPRPPVIKRNHLVAPVQSYVIIH